MATADYSSLWQPKFVVCSLLKGLGACPQVATEFLKFTCCKIPFGVVFSQ